MPGGNIRHFHNLRRIGGGNSVQNNGSSFCESETKRKLNEDVETKSIESPAKRRVQITSDNAPKVQNICDEEAPEVQ